MDIQRAFRNSSTSKNEFFAKLKPCCVAISRLSMRQDDDVSAAAAPLTALTGELYGILAAQADYDASVIDAKIAEYVFFPLSFIFRRTDDYPARLIENATKCLRVLIQHGWKSSISKELSQQLLVLLTFIVGGVPGREGQQARRPQVPEETTLEGYRALTALIKAAGTVAAPVSPLVEASVIPALGHTVTVILEGVTDGVTPGIQLEALEALDALYTTVKDQEALASFLPGTVSSLARLLSPPAANKARKRVLVRGLEVLRGVLVSTLGDLQTRHIVAKAKKSEGGDGKEEKSDGGKLLTASWLKATASQVKIALSTILKLRTHEADEVRDAVQQLCVCLLDECHSSLAECTSILVESAIITSPQADGRADELPSSESDKYLHGPFASSTTPTALQGLRRDTTLNELVIVYPELVGAVKTAVYNWTTSLPRLMQSGDEDVKQLAIRNLHRGIKLARSLQVDSSVLEDTLATALRDSVVTLAISSVSKSSAGAAAIDESDAADDLASGELALTKPSEGAGALQYRPVLLAREGQKRTRQELSALIADVGSPSQQAALAAEMLSYAQDSSGTEQVSSYWLSFELVKAAFAKSAELDEFLDLSGGDDEPGEADAVFHDLYSFSVSILASHSDSSSNAEAVDWRSEALALEVTAFAASRTGEAFRPELIDVLYPVATFLGSPRHPQLRRHAVVTLNALAAACGYGGDVSALIVDNVDYMVSAASLRLNTLDVSPASTRVLAMMVRLAGPRLVPYLDDAVAAIFAALDNYHGYPAFVEGLFGVLAEIVQQAVRASGSALLIEGAGAAPVDHRKKPPAATTTEDILAVLDKRAEKRKRLHEDEDGGEVSGGHPKRPWKSEADELLRKHEIKEKPDGDGDEEEQEDSQEVAKPEPPKPPPTPTYALLARITTLTQHYLTSPTPTLRRALLELLATAAPALAPDPDAFLPLVAAVWPVAVARLRDGEAYVAAAACRALAALCAAAGEFLASRVKTEWWDGGLGRWCAAAKREAGKAKGKTAPRGAAGAGRRGSSARDSSSGGQPTGPIHDKSSSTSPKHGGDNSGRRPHGRGGGSSSSGVGGGVRGVGGILIPVGHHHHQPATTTTIGGSTTSSSSSALAPQPLPATVSTTTLSSGGGGLGRFAQAAQRWEAAKALLTSLVAHVRLDDELFDEVLDLLVDEIDGDDESGETRAALEAVNADAVWLALYYRRYGYGRRGRERGGRLQGVEDGLEEEEEEEEMMPTRVPVLDGVNFVQVR